MSATLNGHIGHPPSGGTNLVVRFFTPNTDTEVAKACAPTDANGDFTIYGITPGTYDVGIKCAGSLSNLAEDKIFTDGNTTNIDFSDIRMGDLDNNDFVDILDRTIMYKWWGLTGGCHGYAGDWLLPECPVPPPPGGACYGYVIS